MTSPSPASIRRRSTSARGWSSWCASPIRGAEHFYLVHEYGHIALLTSDEAAADCWAAREMAKAANGERYLAATIRHFRRRGEDPSRRYGTPLERAERIRSCAEAPG